MNTFIIAEAGVNHNGDVKLAKKLCQKAKEIGVDAIKFQTWITEELITKDVKQAEYQAQNTGLEESQFEMLKKLELSQEDFREIKRYCEEIGITFASTADEEKSLDFLMGLGIPFIKVGSGEIGNIPFLRKIGEKGLPIILSTGMSSLGDVEISLEALRQGGATDITLLHCTTNYPCPLDTVNLKAMDTLREAFGLKVGYSDHTEGIEVAIAAVARGACVIEKHFTLDKNMVGPDHLASTDPKEFKEMIQSIRNIEKALGSARKEATKEEKEIAKVVKKRIVAQREIPQGKVIEARDITTKRSGEGILAKYWDECIGRTAKKHYLAQEAIDW